MTTAELFIQHVIVFASIALIMVFSRWWGRMLAQFVVRYRENRQLGASADSHRTMTGGTNRHGFPGRTKPLLRSGLLASGRLRLSSLLFAAVLGGSLNTTAAADESWSSFQNGGNSSASNQSRLRAWDSVSDASWRAEIPGYGQSSPVVWNGRVYVTSVSGPKKETYHISAFQLTDGEKLWQHDVKNASPQESSNYVSRAAPSPVVDETGVICFFEGGNLVALTHANELRWERNLVDEYGKIEGRHGLGASVEQDATTAFVWVERSEEPYVLAVDKKSGKNKWKVPGIGATSWSSPRLIPVGETRHLVFSAVGSLTGLDPASGARLWSLDGINGNSTPTPVPLGDGRFLIGATTGRGGSRRGGRGRSSTGGEGAENAPGGRAAKSNGVVQISQNGEGQWSADYLWRAERATSSFGSPIAHDGHAYFVNRSGVLYCLDLKTGQEHYAKRLGGSIWATPIAAAQQILFFGKDGTVYFVKPGPEFEKIASAPVWAAKTAAKPQTPPGRGGGFSGPILYAASILNERVLIRTGKELICYGQ